VAAEVEFIYGSLLLFLGLGRLDQFVAHCSEGIAEPSKVDWSKKINK